MVTICILHAQKNFNVYRCFRNYSSVFFFFEKKIYSVPSVSAHIFTEHMLKMVSRRIRRSLYRNKSTRAFREEMTLRPFGFISESACMHMHFLLNYTTDDIQHAAVIYRESQLSNFVGDNLEPLLLNVSPNKLKQSEERLRIYYFQNPSRSWKNR